MKRRIAVGFTFAVFLLAGLIGTVGGRDLLAELLQADFRILALGVLSGLLALTIALVYRACTYWLTIAVGGAAAGLLLLRDS